MNARIFFPSLLTVVNLTAALCSAQTGTGYTLDPATALAGQAFDLHLLSYGFTCATLYDTPTARFDSAAETLYLSFLDHEKSGVACLDIYMPYGPTFKVSALRAGIYKVMVNRLQMNAVVEAGILSVTGAPSHAGWYLKDKTVAADKAFTLQLLQDSLAACTNFSNQQAVVSASGIRANFLRTTGKCSAVSSVPIGPAFDLPALKTGLYPVTAYEFLACETTQPPCVVDRPFPAPSDTLIVVNTLAVWSSDLRAAVARIEWRGRTATFSLPQGKAGTWHAEVLALDGSRLDQADWMGSGGDRVSMRIAENPGQRLRLLRLTAPDGAQTLRALPL